MVVLERLTRTSGGALRDFARVVGNTFGFMNVTQAGSFLFFLIYMILLNWRRFRYEQRLIESLAHIAQGNFDHAVPVAQNNEVTLLAQNVNLLVERLQRSLDEERRTERSKNELVTNVSHDLRTPLTSILGYLGLIDQDRYRDEVELRQYVQIAYAKAQRLNVLINDLFEYTRMNSASAPLRATSVNVSELVEQLLDHYRLPLREAGMEGRLNAGPGFRNLRVWADPVKLVRVFENLLANAMTYGKDGRIVDFIVSSENGTVLVEVVNYGEPIPESDLPRLFERFYRVDKARTSDNGGAGLGLAIAKGLVEKHGGTIRALSDENSTSFQVRLPLYAETVTV
ncbi:GHKL domain-containing protein [Cohnella sp. CFH 77786]|nr:GHKL domain-containing protein [Cohnella sp. CFH 77786]